MFNAGQRVRHRVKAITGKILEVDGSTAYLETGDGVEMQFQVADLKDDTSPSATTTAAAPAMDVKYQRLLDQVPESVVGLATVAYARSPGNPRTGWTTAPARQRLDWVLKVTGLSFDELSALATTGKGKQIEAYASVASRKR